MSPDLGAELVLDAQTVLADLDHVRRYWRGPRLHEAGAGYRLRAATLLERVPGRGRLVAGLVRLELDDPPPDRLDPVEEELARRIAAALVVDGWIDLAGAPLDAVVSSIEHSGAIQTTRPPTQHPLALPSGLSPKDPDQRSPQP